ncbi:hypothetical protein NQ314_005402 [Rhamnusium bicolor]|uniref:Uncharacterized protein n=1 Tax=Rhamnusium bicolor TaxID=1586634 RepID=A0AAV8ZJW3_9CUCU|nr:hypothetical protein NQ314_005402 [Rhamnusium bicolor]
MVARGEKSRCQSPCFNVHVELDNKALKAKNNGLTQTVAKLQQDNAELSKQITLLQGETFEIKSRYNNLKNVISIIDSTTKSCLPKLNEVVETFTGIIQLCSVASNISNSNRDTRTQAVKPQIVNGHVLHNPTITLSRFDNDDISYTPPRPSTSRISSNIVIRPSTSHGSNEVNRERNSNVNGSLEEDNNSDSDNRNENEANEEEDTSFICQATRGVCKRKQSNNDMSMLEGDDLEDSDEDLELPLAEEEENEDQCDQRLTTIQEDEEEEEEEEPSNPLSPRSRQRRFLKGRLQEVRIYLNQLPTTSIEQFRGSGNISISVSPPERRSSYMQRSSSLVGEPNGSLVDNRRSFLDENLSMLNRSFSKNLSPIHNLPSSTTSRASTSDSNDMPSLTLEELGLVSSDDQHRKTSTPIVPRKSNENFFNRSGMFDSPNKSSKSETSLFKTNVTKRRITSREKKRIAQVLLNRLSMEKKLSGSPIDKIKGMVNSPPITQRVQMRTRSKEKRMVKVEKPEEESMENDAIETTRKTTRKQDSPTKKI